MKDAAAELEELRRELNYMRRMAEAATGRLLWADNQTMANRRELEQKQRGFRLMVELALTLEFDSDYETVLTSVCRRLNAALSMQRTVILIPNQDSYWRAAVSQGYPMAERKALEKLRLKLDQELLKPLVPLLITGADPADRLTGFRQVLGLPFFISSAVMLDNDIAALLVTGRVEETRPFNPRLGRGDVETVQALSAYLAALMSRQRLAEMEGLVSRDPLTGLYNRRGIKKSLSLVLSLAKRGGYQVAVLFADLDEFKAINDTYGHAAGDAVLRVTAGRLQSGLRESDLVGRLGGDEFVIVLSQVTRAEDVSLLAGRILEKLTEPIDVHGTLCQVGASIGIAMFPEQGTEAAGLLEAADEAMYAVKKSGKNSFGFA
jgi:diguanylate cyclase (GGDEF)-like protein